MHHYTMKTAAHKLGLSYSVLHHCVQQLSVGQQSKPGGVRLFSEADLGVITAHRLLTGNSGRPPVANARKLKVLRAKSSAGGTSRKAHPISEVAQEVGYSITSVHRLINKLHLGWQDTPGGPRFLSTKEVKALLLYRTASRPGRQPGPQEMIGNKIATLPMLEAYAGEVKLEDQKVLKMSLVDRLSVSEIARSVGTSRQAIDQKLKGARRRLIKVAIRMEAKNTLTVL